MNLTAIDPAPAYRSSRTKLLLLCSALLLPLMSMSRAQVPLEPTSSTASDGLSDHPKVAAVQFGLDNVVSTRRTKHVFQKVALQPLQVVDVFLQYPDSFAARPIAVEPLDGGRILTPQENLVVSADGGFSFRFEAGQNPGLYQIRMHYGGEAVGIQFWVLDLEHPENTPIVLRPN